MTSCGVHNDAHAHTHVIVVTAFELVLQLYIIETDLFLK